MLSEQFLPIFQAFDASVSLVCRRQPCQDVFLQFGTAIAFQNSGDTQQGKEHEVMESVGFLLSVKRRRYDSFQSLESWLPLLIAAVVLIVLIWAILKFLSKMHEDVDPAEADREMLQALRDLRREGDLTEDEFRSIRGKLSNRLNTLPTADQPAEKTRGKSAENAAESSPQSLVNKLSPEPKNTELISDSKEESVQPE